MTDLQVSDFTAPQWRAAKEEYERRMSPIEQRISQKLKELFGAVILPGLAGAVARGGAGGRGQVAAGGGSALQPAQVFQELKRYSGLLGRPLIAATLAGEKDALAKQVGGERGFWHNMPISTPDCSVQHVMHSLHISRDGHVRTAGFTGLPRGPFLCVTVSVTKMSSTCAPTLAGQR